MKVNAIWDLHWKNTWEQIVKKEKQSDKIIFIWDYFDVSSRNKISSEKELDNFKKILNLKNDYSDKVSLLIWNHELHYFNEIDIKYSGYNKEFFRKNWKHFKTSFWFKFTSISWRSRWCNL
jgi:hypothetical protein